MKKMIVFLVSLAMVCIFTVKITSADQIVGKLVYDGKMPKNVKMSLDHEFPIVDIYGPYANWDDAKQMYAATTQFSINYKDHFWKNKNNAVFLNGQKVADHQTMFTSFAAGNNMNYYPGYGYVYFFVPTAGIHQLELRVEVGKKIYVSYRKEIEVGQLYFWTNYPCWTDEYFVLRVGVNPLYNEQIKENSDTVFETDISGLPAKSAWIKKGQWNDYYALFVFSREEMLLLLQGQFNATLTTINMQGEIISSSPENINFGNSLAGIQECSY
jgi:hypothetical protein